MLPMSKMGFRCKVQLFAYNKISRQPGFQDGDTTAPIFYVSSWNSESVREDCNVLCERTLVVRCAQSASNGAVRDSVHVVHLCQDRNRGSRLLL